jgi:undecaprenyl-diphosphatase
MFLQLLTEIEKLDREVFMIINSENTNVFFDKIMPWLRNSSSWIPLYIALVAYIVWKKKKQSLAWIAAIIIAVVLSDQISSHVIKPFVARLRPCANPYFYTHVRLLLKQCSTAYSFTSSHAANHFEMASFIYFSFKKFDYNMPYIWFFWAAIICYAQVYVGVHYPLDVAAGGVLGLGLGYIVYALYNKIVLKES